MASNLREEFPEVNQSTIHDLLKAYGNDKQKVANVLREMEDESKGTADKHKVDELRNLFPSIPVQDIQAVLASVNGNVEDAIVPLFSKHEELQKDAERKKEAERKKQWEEQARKRREEESRKQAQHLMDVFATIPKETIQQILDQNEGDLEETTSKLLAIVAEQEEAEHAKRRAEQEKRQKEEEKRLKVQALKEQLPDVDEKEIVAALTDSDWDLKRAISKVLHATNERLKAEMKGLFASITEEEIDNALFKANWVRAKTVQALSELVYKKELEKARQEKERLERERAEKARREAEELRARLEEQARQERDRLEKERLERERLELEKQARDAAEREALAKRLQEEARIKAEQDRLLREEEARLEAERLERERQERERIERERLEKERLERERAEQEQVKAPNLFEVSTMLGEKIENEIAELKTDLNDLQAQVNAEFITKLQLIIESQARNGTTPGVVPAPLPKQIDELLAQQSAEKPQVDDDRSQHLDEAPAATDKARPDEHPAESASSDKEPKCSVVLKAVPEVVDSANTITVTFEVVGGKSTASDWIGMFPAGQSHTRNYVTYEWRGKEEQKGTIQFTAPTVYGNYEFVYFYNRTYEILAKSNIVRVAPEIAVVAAIDEAAKVIRVKWNQVSGNTYSRPWIGLYEKSQPNNKSYLAWTYANKMEVTVPLPTKPKEYELRFFTNSYNDVARSNTVVIEGEDKLSAAIENKILVVRPNLVTVDPATDHVWIGIYPVVQPDNHQWTRYKNVPHPTNEITFKTPLKPGEYEVRLFANKTYDVVKRSNAFVVPPPQ